ncbi:transporter [Thermosulfidibacter takaii ABI70S6]|uniref:Transporter n=1 Tax=Thermosulfidibacter takaii (strain DSM 17441 / JCM 13301 / NBRC 103674 / ABI70S6) TaxID=1298851 RepID=A0A0S3QRJ8_THET7|nr:sodium:proton antiporter [Thermosulfidibacter takaii]BAT70948.1 transporter [Thermosulfidibacter takaii ABI70S6]
MGKKGFLLTVLILAASCTLAFAGEGEHAVHLGEKLPLWSSIPFAGILLSIAIFPLVAPEFWHHHYPKVSAFWALVVAIPLIYAFKGVAIHEILHIYIGDYIPFIILLWSLYTVAGGILLRGTLRGTPLINTLMLAFGTLIASWVGTTGAAMIMIRPFLRANAHRKYRTYQVVFFIFLVCNIGGILTPLGDPPLFLGFLHGVPFFWTTLKLLPILLVCCAVLLPLFFLIDLYFYRKEKVEQPADDTKLKIEGLHNLIFLAGIVGAVLFSGMVRLGNVNILGVERELSTIIRDVVMVIMGLLSLKTTPWEIRKDNDFTWFPILEVAYLFAGIFMTMIPPIAILKAGEKGALAGFISSVREPAHFFWATGILSSFLDNAPTYLTFLNTALGRFFAGMPEHQAVHMLIQHKSIYLEAISAGAVLMGANTYIGNAPNFMVRSIAEEAGVPMPSFFGYILKYSLPILIPTFILITFIFFA